MNNVNVLESPEKKAVRRGHHTLPGSKSRIPRLRASYATEGFSERKDNRADIRTKVDAQIEMKLIKSSSITTLQEWNQNSSKSPDPKAAPARRHYAFPCQIFDIQVLVKS